MEISFCSHPNNNIVIATIFGTWHDSWAVVACAKFCRDMITSNWIKAKWNFHRIWIVMEKSLVKWVPAPYVRGFNWWPVDGSTQKGPIMQNVFPFHDVIMIRDDTNILWYFICVNGFIAPVFIHGKGTYWWLLRFVMMRNIEVWWSSSRE